MNGIYKILKLLIIAYFCLLGGTVLIAVLANLLLLAM